MGMTAVTGCTDRQNTVSAKALMKIAALTAGLLALAGPYDHVKSIE